MLLENKLTDQEIVEGIKAKKANAFNYFYDRYAGAFYGEIKKTTSQETVACDILASVFNRIYTNIQVYNFKQPLFIWAMNIVRKETSRKKMELVLSELFYCQAKPGQPTFKELRATA